MKWLWSCWRDQPFSVTLICSVNLRNGTLLGVFCVYLVLCWPEAPLARPMGLLERSVLSWLSPLCLRIMWDSPHDTQKTWDHFYIMREQELGPNFMVFFFPQILLSALVSHICEADSYQGLWPGWGRMCHCWLRWPQQHVCLRADLAYMNKQKNA